MHPIKVIAKQIKNLDMETVVMRLLDYLLALTLCVADAGGVPAAQLQIVQ
jgi:hypothetical protein